MSRRLLPTASVARSAAGQGTDLLVEAAAIVGDSSASPAMLQDLVERLRHAGEEATRRAEETEATAADLVLDATDDELDASDAAIRALRRQATRCIAWAEKLASRLVEVEADRAESERRRRYDAASERVAAVEAWVLGAYAEHAAAIAEGLAEMIDVASDVDAANADLPAGARPLDVERFRELPPVPERQVLRPSALAGAVFLPRRIYDEADFWPRRSRLWESPVAGLPDEPEISTSSALTVEAEEEDGGGG